MTNQQDDKTGEVLPCPFCGTHPHSGEVLGSDITGERCGYWAVECPKCNGSDGLFCGVHGEARMPAVRAWNTRHTPPVQPSDVAREAAEEAANTLSRVAYGYSNRKTRNQFIPVILEAITNALTEKQAEVDRLTHQLSKPRTCDQDEISQLKAQVERLTRERDEAHERNRIAFHNQRVSDAEHASALAELRAKVEEMQAKLAAMSGEGR